MQIKLIQVNIFKGRYLEGLVDFLKIQAPDIVFMQEVTAGEINQCADKSLNLFEYLKKQTGLEGVFFSDAVVIDRPGAFSGNAILTRFDILESRQVVLNKNNTIRASSFEDSSLFPGFPRSLVEARLNCQGKEIYAFCVHGAWTAPPEDTEETLRQAKIIKETLKSANAPFVFGGDMNSTPDKKVIKMISAVGVNQITGTDITRTTHPVVHKTVSFKPEGLIVDYLITSKEFERINVEAPNVLVSDHLPVVGTFEFEG